MALAKIESLASRQRQAANGGVEGRNEAVMSEGEPIFILFVLPGGRRANLCCSLGAVSNGVDLPGTEARTIKYLQQARDEDKDIPAKFRGFRRASQLAAKFSGDKFSLPIAAATVTAYLYQLCKRIEKGMRAADLPLRLIERVPNTGARLLYPVQIRYVGCEPGADPADSA
jgi:hypothetical protein